jgi:hypothetical protein
LREGAAKAICSIGQAETRLRLKPLAIERLSEDEYDQLKGYALSAVWPDHLTVEELFQALTLPKRGNFHGQYQRFVNHELVPRLSSENLFFALDWLKDQGLRGSGGPFQQLGNALLLKAWENFDLPGIAESFTQAALIQWRAYQEIIINDTQQQKQFADSLLQDSNKRQSLIEQAVLALLDTGEDPSDLTSRFTEDILVSEDVFWILKKLQSSNCIEAQKIWAQLLFWSKLEDVNQLDAIIAATQTNDILRKTFSPRLKPIDLDSPQAEEFRTNHLKIKERQPQRQMFAYRASP